MFDVGLLSAAAPFALSGLGAIGGSLGSVRFIQESQRGVKLRWGKAVRGPDGNPRVYEPGWVLTLPTIHSLKRIHVRTQTLELDPQRVMLADHTVFNVGALVVTRVIDTAEAIYASLFEVDDVGTSVEQYCAATLRDVLLGIRYPDLADPLALAEQVRERVAPRLAEWGVQVEDVKLTDCSPTTETARLILTQNEALFRATALKAAIEELGVDHVSPTLAAALIGTPVSVALADSQDGSSLVRPARHVANYSVQIGSRKPVTDSEER